MAPKAPSSTRFAGGEPPDRREPSPQGEKGANRALRQISRLAKQVNEESSRRPATPRKKSPAKR